MAITENKERTITIKKVHFEITVKREQFVECSQSADGIVFMFKGGILLQFTENNMPLSVKNIIKTTVDRMANANLFIDLMNYKQPIRAEIPHEEPKKEVSKEKSEKVQEQFAHPPRM